ELAVRVHAELPGGMVTRGPARHACFNDGGQAEFSDYPQRFPADVRSAALSGHTGTAKIVHGFANSKAYGEVPGSALRRCELPPGSVAYGQRLKADRAGWRDVAHQVAWRKPA